MDDGGVFAGAEFAFLARAVLEDEARMLPPLGKVAVLRAGVVPAVGRALFLHHLVVLGRGAALDHHKRGHLTPSTGASSRRRAHPPQTGEDDTIYERESPS